MVAILPSITIDRLFVVTQDETMIIPFSITTNPQTTLFLEQMVESMPDVELVERTAMSSNHTAYNMYVESARSALVMADAIINSRIVDISLVANRLIVEATPAFASQRYIRH